MHTLNFFVSFSEYQYCCSIDFDSNTNLVNIKIKLAERTGLSYYSLCFYNKNRLLTEDLTLLHLRSDNIVVKISSTTAAAYAHSKYTMAKLSNKALDEHCCICFDKSIDVIFDSCYHMSFCKACVSRLSHCPLCRQQIDTAIIWR